MEFGFAEIPRPLNPFKIDVVGVGAATLDDLWLVPSFSKEEGVMQAGQHIQMSGGPVATALCVLASLGHSVALLDVAGNDVAGQTVARQLAESGVGLSGMRIVEDARSARAVVLVRENDGARQIAYLPSTAGELKLDAGQMALLRQARLLHINGRHEEAAREAVAVAAATGSLISFDGGAGRYRDSVRDLVDQSHIKILSIDFARRFCDSDEWQAMMEMLLLPRAQIVVLTDGVRGSYVGLPDGSRLHQPAFRADPLVDTTGCGDVYHGAFLHGLLKGWPPKECAALASQMAAKNAEGLGGRWVCQGLKRHS